MNNIQAKTHRALAALIAYGVFGFFCVSLSLLVHRLWGGLLNAELITAFVLAAAFGGRFGDLLKSKL